MDEEDPTGEEQPEEVAQEEGEEGGEEGEAAGGGEEEAWGGDARGRDCQRGFTPPLADGFVMFGGGDIRQHGWGIQYVGTITVCIHLRTILLHDKGKM